MQKMPPNQSTFESGINQATEQTANIFAHGDPQYRTLIIELTAALEQLLEDGMGWSSEHDAEIVLRRAQKYLSQD